MNSTSPRLRLAMIGLGPQGQEHLGAASQASGVSFVAGVDTDAARREATALRYPELAGHVHASLADLREDLRQGLALDGVVLALPHHAYGDCWDEIVAMGLPLLKEKPLGRNQDEARHFLNKARLAGCPLQTAIQRRHHPSYRYLRDALRESGEAVLEVHAHLHLGFALPQASAQISATDWRNDAKKSGGGTLLDSGYHMVDLLHDVVGPFELVASTLMRGDRLVGGDEIEDRVWLSGRAQGVWVLLDSWLHGEPDASSKSGFRKSEGLLVRTEHHQWRADRSGVWRNDQPEPLYTTRKDWEAAMAEQLDGFARRILDRSWHDATLWEQLPAMRIIDQAYQQALHF